MLGRSETPDSGEQDAGGAGERVERRANGHGDLEPEPIELVEHAVPERVARPRTRVLGVGSAPATLAGPVGSWGRGTSGEAWHLEKADRGDDRLAEERLDPLDDVDLGPRSLFVELDRPAGDPGDRGEGPQRQPSCVP